MAREGVSSQVTEAAALPHQTSTETQEGKREETEECLNIDMAPVQSTREQRSGWTGESRSSKLGGWITITRGSGSESLPARQTGRRRDGSYNSVLDRSLMGVSLVQPLTA